MNGHCNLLNPLQRDGVSQRQRLVRALHPSFVSVDERDLSDMLLYARKYAELLRYYNADNLQDGDWTVFIEKDISTLCAIIARTNLDSLREDFDQKLAYARANALAQPQSVAPLFGTIYEMAFLADGWWRGSVSGLNLHTVLQKVIRSVLADAVADAGSYALKFNFLNPSTAPELNHPMLHDVWDIQTVVADATLFPSGTATAESMAIFLDRVKSAFKRLYDGLLSLIQQAPGFLEETISKYPQHEPHIALFLAFISIFKIAQQHQNTLTREHLNFYYKDILGLKPNPAKPDAAHIVFTLAKNFEPHLLEKHLALNAGKDSKNVSLVFHTDDALVVNKTSLATHGLKSVFIDKAYQPDGTYTIQNIHAAPVANSLDGLGADLEDEQGKWPTFGNTTRPFATVGFAVASPMFWLKEAKRVVTLTFDVNKPVQPSYGNGFDYDNQVAQEIRHNLLAYYSGEKGWEPLTITRVNIKLGGTKQGKLTLTLELPSGAEPCVAYNPEKLEGGFVTKHPVFKFIFDNNGLSAGALCGQAIQYLDDITEAKVKIPASVQQSILQFLNLGKTWEDIAAIEPLLGPVIDSPDTGSAPGNFDKGYDVGEVVARRILDRRNNVHAGKFTTIEQLYNIKGFGVDKMNDLYYTFCIATDITNIKRSAQPFFNETTYLAGSIVTYNGAYFKALTKVKGQFPTLNSPLWQHLPKSYPYKYFQHLDLYKLTIETDVSDMTGLILENDLGTINPAKPFQPFGPLPKVGSSFFIGNAEVFQKRLADDNNQRANLKLSIDWADLPKESFSAHYANYNLTDKPSNEDFKVEIETLENGEWISDNNEVSLFTGNGAPVGNSPIQLKDLFTQRNLRLPPFKNLEPGLSRGFIRLRLLNDFLHKNFGPSVTQQVITPGTAPNEPYTPTIRSFKLSYYAKEVVDYTAIFRKDFDDRVEQFFHIEPFGWKEIFPVQNAVSDEKVTVSARMAPGFEVVDATSQDTPPSLTDAEGTLYIGLNNLEPEQIVTILFQVAEGSADPEKATQPVFWSYMSYNRWINFENTEILSDTTNGLLTSGIVKFAMPKTMSHKHTSLPGGTFWIKVSASRDTDAICKVIAVMPQAVRSTFFITPENDLNRLKSALPAETIAKLVDRRAAIKSVQQPFATFGGAVAESLEAPASVTGEAMFDKVHNEFYVRVSERLRHKNRGITIFDYERIVLQQFPDIYKVRCLNHTMLPEQGAGSPEHAPGHVKIIVLPNLRNQNAVDPLRPMVSKNRLEEIRQFLRPLISDFVLLEVRNPQFERVRIECKVRFFKDVDKGFYTQKLQQDIVRFLSPWLYEEARDLELGGKVHRSSIINFIEETGYVDFLTDFKMHHLIPENNGWTILENVEEAIANTSSSVIVAAPALEQNIILFDQSQCLTTNTY
ncbi:MAG: hypothetical protein IT270_06905 [Saprospiraceae bacterium]|nr:hypothetical protein [Saprospiraceae bacterium]